MKKLHYYISDVQAFRLKALAEATGLSQSEIIRRFLEDGLDREEAKRKERDR